MRRVRVTLATLLAVLAARGAIGAGGGSSGAEFLRVAMGARPAGLGESFTGLADDVTAVAWNPAGLGQLENAQFSAMHLAWFSDISYEYLAGSYPLGGMGSIGVSAAYVNVPPFDSTAPGSGEAKGTAADGMFGVSWGGALSLVSPEERWLGGVFYGATAKVIYRSLGGYAPLGGTPASYSAVGAAVDLGFLYRSGEAFTAGLSCMNLGGPMTFLQDEGDAMPVTVRAGVGWRAWDKGSLRVTALADVAKPVDPDGGKFASGTWGGAGVEVTGFGFVTVRGGYRMAADGGRVVGGAGFTYGQVSIDGALVPMGDFGTTWRAGITLKLGIAERRLPAVQDAAAEGLEGGRIGLKWTPVYGAAGYQVDVLTPGAETYRRLTKAPIEAPEMTLGKLKGGERYRFRIVPVSPSGREGEPADADYETPPDTPPFPAAPVKVAAKVNGPGQVLVSWSPVPGASGYHIWFRPVGGKWAKFTKTPVKETALACKGINGGPTEFQVAPIGPKAELGKARAATVMVPSSGMDAF
ncbi:MAG: PorV/PorQ family protein [Candidatus Coatesbacteria bacterium]